MNEGGDGWRKVRMVRLCRLLNEVRPELKWQWRVAEKNGRKQLLVVSPRGVEWEFRLHKGAFLRRTNGKGPVTSDQ